MVAQDALGGEPDVAFLPPLLALGRSGGWVGVRLGRLRTGAVSVAMSGTGSESDGL